jgi:hypothetical protein
MVQREVATLQKLCMTERGNFLTVSGPRQGKQASVWATRLVDGWLTRPRRNPPRWLHYGARSGASPRAQVNIEGCFLRSQPIAAR